MLARAARSVRAAEEKLPKFLSVARFVVGEFCETGDLYDLIDESQPPVKLVATWRFLLDG